MRKGLLILVSLAALGMFSTVSSAATLGVDYISAPGSALCNTSICVYGFQFSVTSAITVSALGAFDGGQGNPSNPPGKPSNLTNVVTVDLFNSAGTIIRTAQVGGSNVATAGTQVGNWWAFNPITPVDLTVGSTYIVAAVFSTDDISDSIGSFNTTFGSGITFLQFESCRNQVQNPPVNTGSCTNPPLTSQFVTTTNQNQGALGGNIQFAATASSTFNAAAVPEPGTLVLLGSGLLGAARLRRRMRS